MTISALSNCIKKQTPTYMTVYGGMTKQKEIVDAFVEETTSFLLKNKGKCLSLKDVFKFYKTIFPEIKLNIKKRSLVKKKEFENYCNNAPKKPSFFEKIKKWKKLDDVCGSCEVLIHPKKNFVKGFFMQLPDYQTPWFVKKVLRMQNPKEGKFFVDKDFTNVFLHEGVHLVQTYMKPSATTHKRMLLKYAKNRALAQKLEKICTNVYQENIYEKGFAGKTRQRFINEIIIGLNNIVKMNDWKLYNPTKKVVMTQLKAMIRSFENEKQAYEKGERIVYKLKYPFFEKFAFLRKHTDKKVKEMVNNYFYFDEKIKILKDIYMDLAKQEKLKMGLVK